MQASTIKQNFNFQVVMDHIIALFMDRISKEKRSEIMSKIRSKDTAPELKIRKILHSLGFRYRLHVASLPGKPDIVFTKKKKLIFVNGCFWHQHENCPNSNIPKTRIEFWEHKLKENVLRDKRNIAALKQQGWQVMVVWECEVDNGNIVDKLRKFLEESANLQFNR